MMIQTDPNQTEFVDFYLPFNGRLKASNRWTRLSEMVPWDVVESCYAESFADTGMGAPAKSGRIAYGALLIKERLGITDEETVEANGESMKKPRTYRRKARKQYLAVAKQKKPGAKKIRKAIGQQLNYLQRNLGHIAKMAQAYPGMLGRLPRYDYKCLLVIHTLYEQQRQMHTQRVHSVPDRIVSISQPHVRPIVRGKAGKRVEFGAKISISHIKEGYVSLNTLSWDAYNEGSDLPGQIEAYKKRFGYYPASVHADTIYRTRENRKYCKNLGIRMSGKPLGSPKKETAENKHQLKAEKLRRRQDEIDRIPVEGKFGNSKRKGTLGRIMAKLTHTSESVIHVGIVVLNLDKWLAELLLRLLRRLNWLHRATQAKLVLCLLTMTPPNHPVQ